MRRFIWIALFRIFPKRTTFDSRFESKHDEEHARYGRYEAVVMGRALLVLGTYLYLPGLLINRPSPDYMWQNDSSLLLHLERLSGAILYEVVHSWLYRGVCLAVAVSGLSLLIAMTCKIIAAEDAAGRVSGDHSPEAAFDITNICRLRRMRRSGVRAMKYIVLIPLASYSLALLSVYVLKWLARTLLHESITLTDLANAGAIIAGVGLLTGTLLLLARSAERGNLIANAAQCALLIFVLEWGFLNVPMDPRFLAFPRIILTAIVFATPVTFVIRGFLAQLQLNSMTRLNVDFAALFQKLDRPEPVSHPLSPSRRKRVSAVAFQGGAITLCFIAYELFFLLTAEAHFDPEINYVRPAFAVVSLFLTALAAVLYRWSLRIAAIQLAELRALDPRAPVLFLRAFADDNTRVRRIFRWRNLLAGFRTGLTLESVIVNAMSAIGPVVALGRPGERLSPVGAARDYLPAGADWKVEVIRLSAESTCIVAVAGNTPGILWEYEHLARESLFKRLVLVFPPGKPTAITTRHDLLVNATGVPSLLERLTPRRRLLAAVIDTDGGILIESKFCDEDAYTIATQILALRIVAANPARTFLNASRPRPCATAWAALLAILMFAASTVMALRA